MCFKMKYIIETNHLRTEPLRHQRSKIFPHQHSEWGHVHDSCFFWLF